MGEDLIRARAVFPIVDFLLQWLILCPACVPPPSSPLHQMNSRHPSNRTAWQIKERLLNDSFFKLISCVWLSEYLNWLNKDLLFILILDRTIYLISEVQRNLIALIFQLYSDFHKKVVCLRLTSVESI